MSWVKGMGGAILAAAAMFLAAMAVANAKRQKASADKWKDHAVTAAEADVSENLGSAKAALSQARLFNERAKSAKKKGQQHLDSLAKRDADMASIISSWRKDRIKTNT